MGLSSTLRSMLIALARNKEKPMTLDEAVEYFKGETEKKAMDPEKPEEFYNDFWNGLAQRNKDVKNITPRFKDNPEEMKNRAAYSKKCREAMFEAMKDDVERVETFAAIAEDIYGKNSGVDSARWMHSLIQIPADGIDKDACRRHNEEVVAFAALCEGIPKGEGKAVEKFIEVRTKLLMNGGMTEDAARSQAEEESQKGPEHLFELASELVEEAFRNKQEIRKAANDIVSGEAENMPGGLTAAYRKVMCPANNIMFDSHDAFENLKLFGFKNADYLESIRRNWEFSSFSAEEMIVELVANPYYAVCDPAELQHVNIMNGFAKKQVELLDLDGKPYMVEQKEPVTDEDNNPVMDKDGNPTFKVTGTAPVMSADDAPSAEVSDAGVIVTDVNGRQVNRYPNCMSPYKSEFTTGIMNAMFALSEEKTSDLKAKYALKDAGSASSPEGMFVYTNGRGRTLIAYKGDVSLDGGINVSVNEDVPGKLFSLEYADDLRTLHEKSLKQDRLGHSSSRYRNMKKSLKELEKIHIDDKPTKQQLADAENKLKQALSYAKVYIESKNGIEFERNDVYRKTRLSFAEDLKRFAEKKLNAIKLIRENEITRRDIRIAENDEILETSAGVKVDTGRTAFERYVKAEDDAFAEKERAAAEEKKRQKELKEAQDKKEYLEHCKQNCAVINNMVAEVSKDGMAKKSNEEADKELAEFIASNESVSAKTNDENERAQANKNIIAGKALQQIISMEGTALGDNPPFRKIVNGGKTAQAVEFLQGSKEYRNILGTKPLSSKRSLDSALQSYDADKRLAREIILSVRTVAQEEKANEKAAQPKNAAAEPQKEMQKVNKEPAKAPQMH